jgi:GxxExxY protein
MGKTAFSGKHNELTEKIIGAFYDVYNELGYGFSEKVYENALAISLRELRATVEQQSPITVYFANQIVGEFICDLLVDDKVMLELKSVKMLNDQHEAQLFNYLKATDVEVGLLSNFGPKAEFKRRVFDNGRKGSLSWVRR